jgi:hypothetical protein
MLVGRQMVGCFASRAESNCCRDPKNQSPCVDDHDDDPSDVCCCPPYLALLLVTANINYHVADAVPTHRFGREAIICLDRVEALLLFQRQSKECPLENPTE